ncbi:MAG: hypothetical protein WCC26_09160 [Terracidiphilus sp.]
MPAKKGAEQDEPVTILFDTGSEIDYKPMKNRPPGKRTCAFRAPTGIYKPSVSQPV